MCIGARCVCVLCVHSDLADASHWGLSQPSCSMCVCVCVCVYVCVVSDSVRARVSYTPLTLLTLHSVLILVVAVSTIKDSVH